MKINNRQRIDVTNRKQIVNDNFKPNSDKPNGIKVSSLHIPKQKIEIVRIRIQSNSSICCL